MSLLRINSLGGRVGLHGSAQSARAALSRIAAAGAAAGMAADPLRPAPVIFMVHGYKFDPDAPRHCPHDHIFGTRTDHPCWKAQSWPRHLGALETGAAPLCVAFGWSARGRLRDVYGRAATAGRDLAEAVRIVRRAAPCRPVHIVTHSLGARVAFAAMEDLEAHDLTRVLALSAAEFTGAARRAAGTACGRRAEILHITSAENGVFDHLLRWGLPAPEPRDVPMGLGLREAAQLAPNMVQICLGRADVLAQLAQMGFAITAPQRRVCHWSIYLREGVWPLYRTLIERPEALPIGVLRALGSDGAPASRSPMPAHGGAGARQALA